ncbi:GNAT family N-acetyltransferase [Dongia sedimenti]|uniref:N-acetyltransferase n=1 Tax=Dongia sedimenti TaxID=3064282 RepID=A0ABU0YQL7_9PROT|nr:N-acetyltransferase [Rhodospirillaceae bacterium R-7]
MSMRIITSAFRIAPEAAVSTGSVERLYGRVFGPARFRKASHRYRTGLAPLAELSWIARTDDAIVGAIRYWSILVGGERARALLLGPLAVAPDCEDRGIGRALVLKTLDLAAAAGHDLVLLVGDPEYYDRFGFVPATPYGFVMPGESRPERLQVLSLQGRPLERAGGVLRRVSAQPAARQSRAS